MGLWAIRRISAGCLAKAGVAQAGGLRYLLIHRGADRRMSQIRVIRVIRKPWYIPTYSGYRRRRKSSPDHVASIAQIL